MLPSPRAELRGLPPCPHGGDAPAACLDFSTGVSPLPAPASVLAAFRGADLSRYSPPTAEPLRAALGRHHGVGASGVVAGNGSVELIWAVARAFGGEGREALILTPAFGEYAQALRACGTAVHVLPAEEPAFAWQRERLLGALREKKPALVFLCRPSNPCLSALPLEELEEAASAHPRTLFVVDEAYQPLFEGVDAARASRNIVVLRSLTKVFALPGLRLGYLLGEAELLSAVQAALPPWNVSAPALAAGLALTPHLETVTAIREKVSELRRLQEEHLKELGSGVEGRGGPFLLCRVGAAQDFARAMLEAGVRVRDCSSFGLPRHVRIGVRPEAEHPLLLSAWRRAMEKSQ